MKGRSHSFKKIKLVSLQYELSLCFGKELQLNEFLFNFSRHLIEILDITSLHLIVDQPDLIKKYRLEKDEIRFSYPKIQNSWLDSWMQNTQNEIAPWPSYQGQYYYIYVIPEVGCFILTTNLLPMENIVFQSLRPILSKLALRCLSIYDYSLSNKMRQDLVDREFELVEARNIAQKSNQIKSEFLAKMSHEIRTPMNGILGLTELLIENEVEEKKLNKLNLVKSSSDQLLVLINDILDFSKIEAGKIELESRPFSFKKIFNDVFNMFKIKADELKLNFKLNMTDIELDSVQGDPYRLQQILINLVGNAMKFTHHGFVHINVDVQFHDLVHLDLIFSVKDSGIGIEPHMQETIFKSFTQADAAMTRKYGGTGLGLSITRELIQLMNGELNLQSQIDRGSEFKVKIPMKRAMKHNSSTSDSNAKVPSEISAVQNLRLLLVEDNETNIFVAKSMFEKLGHQVFVARDGEEGVKMAFSHDLDIIFMDVQMPIKDGFEASSEIRHRGLTTPIIALTANAMEGDREKCLKSGMNDYLSKPLKFNEIKMIIEKYTLNFQKKEA